MDVQEIASDQPSVTPSLRLPFPDLLADERRNDYLSYGIPLYQAALKGNWEAASIILQRKPTFITARITKQGDSVLHVAAAARHTSFVVKLVNILIANSQIDELRLQNLVGNTALCLAAASGTVCIAEVMVNAHYLLPVCGRNVGTPPPRLHMIRGNKGLTPLHMAALLGHREMVRYLWSLMSSDDLEETDLIALLISTIDTELYDVALAILKGHPELAFARDEHQETPLHVLARKSIKSGGSKSNGSWRRCSKIFSSKYGDYTENAVQFCSVELLHYLWQQVILEPEEKISELMTYPWRLIFAAVQAGNVEFLTILISSYPDLLWKFDENNRSIFHVAVVYRQENIFRLIYEIGTIKDLLATYADNDDNNLLHLAAMLPSSDILNCISGAALQMQREMLWFKVIEDLVQPQVANAKNSHGKTPRDLFTEQHQELRKRGEKWMTKTAASCSVVATLIASVVFGAIFKVPGKDHNGSSTDFSSHGALYRVFAISDALSLISSTGSILMFLSILTSRYAEKDFLRSLPLKLMIGLILLFISIATMMIAFAAIFSIIFNSSLLWIGSFSLCCVPIILFVLQISPLVVDVSRSTIGCKAIFKPQHLLFQ